MRVASRIAPALNSHSDAARVMSVNTIVTSPSGGRTPPVVAPAAAASEVDELDDDDVPEPADEGRVQEPYMLEGAFLPPEWPDDDDVWLVDVPPADVFESPCMADSRVMISRNVGLIVGSVCQQLVISSSYSAGCMRPDWAGMMGRMPSRITATATAAGLRPK
jgi:hypothetical protein